ncbi:hypothetical protein [uncultured Ruegeria sp.]|uniref:hypothetical protein n=2 Tax=uncultured Ruegeria sp. TaxID=259304 RepID=UPI00261D3A2A|nr:hypothetical protein [uncultured Ruegeria sp.]
MIAKRGFVVMMVLTGTLLVSACGTAPSRATRVAFDGIYFRASAKHVNKKATPSEFTVTVNGVSQSFDGAREAARYEGTKFCIQNFGSSRIVWKVGPDTEPQNLRIEKDKLTYAGRCQRP